MYQTRSSARLPRLRRSIDPRLTTAGELYLLRGPDQEDVLLQGEGSELRELLLLTDGTRTTEQIAAGLRARGLAGRIEEVEQAVDHLLASGIVDDAAEELEVLDEHDAERYGRQLACFADLTGGAAPAAAAQRRLLDATVCVLGLGGLGSWVAWALASAGVGGLVGVDGDRLERSNLNRQILYGEDDLGRPKAVAAGEALRRFSRRLRYLGVDERLDSPERVEEAIAGCDLVVSTVDWPAHLIGQWVNEACFSLGIPYVAMTQHPPKVRVGPLYLPGETGCFSCQELTYRERYPLYGELERSEQLVAPSATFGPACGFVGTLAANEVVAQLGRLHHPATLGNALVFDLRSFAVEREPVEQHERCAICREAAPAHDDPLSGSP